MAYMQQRHFEFWTSLGTPIMLLANVTSRWSRNGTQFFILLIFCLWTSYLSHSDINELNLDVRIETRCPWIVSVCCFASGGCHDIAKQQTHPLIFKIKKCIYKRWASGMEWRIRIKFNKVSTLKCITFNQFCSMMLKVQPNVNLMWVRYHRKTVLVSCISWLISFVWASWIYEEWEASENYK